MSQLSDSVTSIALDLGEKAVNLAQDVAVRAQVVGEYGSDLVDSGLKKLQDAGVVAKPKKRSKLPLLLTLLVVVVGAAVAYKVYKGKSASSASSFPEADRLADSTSVPVV